MKNYSEPVLQDMIVMMKTIEESYGDYIAVTDTTRAQIIKEANDHACLIGSSIVCIQKRCRLHSNRQAPIAKRLGSKRANLKASNMLVRQRGTKIHPATRRWRPLDDTLFALIDGTVKFEAFEAITRKVSVTVEDAVAVQT